MLEPTLPPSNQEDIPPRMVTPPPLSVLVPVLEEEELWVKGCCQQTLAVRNQHAIRGRGAITKPYKRLAQMQLALVSKIIAMLQDSCEQRQRVRRLERGLGGYESSSESGDDGFSDSDGSSQVSSLGWRFWTIGWSLDGCRPAEGTGECWGWLPSGSLDSSIWWGRRCPAGGDRERQRRGDGLVELPRG